MAELEARYENNPSFGWRRALSAEPVVLGRVPGLPESTDDDLRVAVCSVARRGALAGSSPPEFRPSRRLVHDAIHRRLSTLHVWNKDPARMAADSKFSLTDPGTDWALCTPLL